MEKQSLLGRALLGVPPPKNVKPAGLKKSKTRMFNVKKTLINKKSIIVESNMDECYTLKQFIMTLQQNMQEVNKYLSLEPKKAVDQRLRFSGDPNFIPSQNDIVYGFMVKLRNNSWT
jgi:hypothetical protein